MYRTRETDDVLASHTYIAPLDSPGCNIILPYCFQILCHFVKIQSKLHKYEYTKQSNIAILFDCCYVLVDIYMLIYIV